MNYAQSSAAFLKNKVKETYFVVIFSSFVDTILKTGLERIVLVSDSGINWYLQWILVKAVTHPKAADKNENNMNADLSD